MRYSVAGSNGVFSRGLVIDINSESVHYAKMHLPSIMYKYTCYWLGKGHLSASELNVTKMCLECVYLTTF